MPLQNADRFVVSRSGTNYYMTADQIADFVLAVRDFTAADITARDALADLTTGDRVFVVDASTDASVDSGWAIYRVASTGPIAFDKIQEQESLDVVVAGVTDLGYTPATNQGTLTSSTGNDAVIPVVNATNAGLATPSMFSASHPAVTTSGTAATNPVTVDGSQALAFSISGLDPLP